MTTLTELFNANQATTNVSSGGTTAPASGTSEMWTVASSAMFGTAATGVSQFHVADPSQPSELIAVTNVSGTTWTVTRGAESTTPVAHAAEFTVFQVASAGWLSSAAGSVNPMTASGDMIYGGTAGKMTRLAGNTSSTPKALMQTGTGSVSAAPAWMPLGGPGELNVVTQYGATGNGSTDDTAAIQAAINANNGAVICPPGTYLVSGLTLLPGTVLQGTTGEGYVNTTTTIPSGGMLSRLLLKSGSTSPILAPNDTGTNLATAVTISNLMLDMNGTAYPAINIPDQGSGISRFWQINSCYITNQSGGSSNAVYIGVNNTGCVMRDCSVFNGQSGSAAGNNGIVIAGADCLIDHCWVGYWSIYGILLDGGASAMALTIRDGGCFGTGFAGIGVGGSGLLIDGVSIDTNQKYGVYIADGTGPGTTFIGCQFHGNGSLTNNTYPNIYVPGNDLLVNVIGCRSYNDGTSNKPSYMISIGGTGAIINEAGNEGAASQFGTGWTNYPGTISAPSFPANAAVVYNTTGVDVQAFIVNGTSPITNMQLGSTLTGWTLAANDTGNIRIPNGQGIEFAYSGGSPTWTWVAG